MSSAVTFSVNAEQLVGALDCVSIVDQGEVDAKFGSNGKKACGNHGGNCAICLDEIVLEETALIKGCEHAYCVTCILHWATYSENPKCPQCKHPFESLNVHRSLDGCIHDYMFEESLCLLLRATWFKPLEVPSHHGTAYEDPDEFFPYDYVYGYGYDYEEDDIDEAAYYSSGSSSSSSVIRIGNRRWGDNGYVRAGRLEARPVHHRPNAQDSGGAGSSSSSSREPRKKEDKTGRRAKRTQKREAADKKAAEKHQLLLARLGRQ
ncbi:unnamed protein product [Linum tenue]|uniref:RING-type domain-containing protein n=1 Tax=Linum tenue TaxID=586396 RepID=A0AAV0QC76_9ROSI|nr:unnamed protein product [Linum tenue]